MVSTVFCHIGYISKKNKIPLIFLVFFQKKRKKVPPDYFSRAEREE